MWAEAGKEERSLEDLAREILWKSSGIVCKEGPNMLPCLTTLTFASALWCQWSDEWERICMEAVLDLKLSRTTDK
jgi:hypothetical protein